MLRLAADSLVECARLWRWGPIVFLLKLRWVFLCILAPPAANSLVSVEIQWRYVFAAVLKANDAMKESILAPPIKSRLASLASYGLAPRQAMLRL
ncbi:hypothetical protein BO99DRAFT_16977 [Aspergillus violaceofuscus CBS 115571]|uniref:Uncharacterized protein n=1 Tax=Aspergillus violaceofuscus (strain CBS 115571) TaxID=1450538 RepID=A0A2V5GTM7_ASPV1|nr:hypothetical protein BO99DRAFT_16977 [Aspergillus violaceofuscus CBS 115571]